MCLVGSGWRKIVGFAARSSCTCSAVNAPLLWRSCRRADPSTGKYRETDKVHSDLGGLPVDLTADSMVKHLLAAPATSLEAVAHSSGLV